MDRDCIGKTSLGKNGRRDEERLGEHGNANKVI